MVVPLEPSPFTFGQDTSRGRHANIFHSPSTSANSATSASLNTATDYFGTSALKRNRSDMRAVRRQFSSTRIPRRHLANPPWLQCPTPNENAHLGTFATDSMFVNEKYTLAGGFDTPSLKARTEVEGQYNFEEDSRRIGREAVWEAQQHEPTAPIFGPLARERNGVPRALGNDIAPQPTVSATSWTGLAFGLVGKMFSFSTNVIRGFYAGGGQGFELNGHVSPLAQPWQDSGCSTPLPGAWTDDDFMGDFEQDNFSSPSSSRKPPNKRRQTDRDAWIVVGDQDPNTHPGPSSPKRKMDVATINPTRGNPPTRPSASRASSRRTIAPTTRRMPSYGAYSNGSPSQQMTNPNNEPRASMASMRSPPARSNSLSSSGYFSPEAERFVKRQARQEKAADRTMLSMSRQLEDLIRQGQEALGTKVSIEGLDYGFDMDEGFVDDD